MHLSASAPAKLIFLGEYAVLEGAPALVAAVDCRAHVTLSGHCGSGWRLSAPQLGIRDMELGENGEIDDVTDSTTRDSLALFDAVRRTVMSQAPALSTLSIQIDTAAFYNNNRKLGLGSSAAVAVALTTALSAAAGRVPDRASVQALASEAHRRAQGGIGSNADIAAAVHGGILGYRSGQTPAPVELPTALWLQPVVLNESASTTELVGRVLELKERAPQAFQSVMQPLQDLAEQGYNAFRAHESTAFTHVFSAYYEALEQLGRVAGADIVSASHEALHSAALDAGIHYKSCGAGGGDLGLLAAAHSQDKHNAAARRIADTTGCTLLEAELGAQGVALENAPVTATL